MPTVPFKVKAVFEYKSEEADDLKFENGQIITVTAEEDADWYNGEYVNALGEKVEGLFPRNFVETYEPTIPSRPARGLKRSTTQEAVSEPPSADRAETFQADEADTSQELPEPVKEEPPAPIAMSKPAPMPSSTTTPKSPPGAPATKPPLPVPEKPTSSSFRDKIAAFNKPAAAPVTPYKPGGGSTSGFIKKPFVAPPPSRNAYVPPHREPPPQKLYRREEDSSLNDTEAKEVEGPPSHQEPAAEDQPKPQSLRDRIALLQKQQMEQAARNVEKKEKPKKPPKKRVETSEPAEEVPQPESPSTTMDANETLGRQLDEMAGDEPETAGPPSRRPTGLVTVTPQPQPSRELVSDTNDADDSGAGDDEDAPETSTEEERPKSKDVNEPIKEPPKQKSVGDAEEQEAGEEDEDEEEDDEEEDPEVRRRRELRERMAKMSGGMGMMGMFGPPGGMAPPGAGRKPKPAESSRQTSENYQQEEPQERAAPIRIMALPGMSNAAQRRQEDPVAAEESSDDETARPTPQEPSQHGEPDDYVSRPLQRRSTDRPPPTPQDRAPPPAPPRETRAPPPVPSSATRTVPIPQSPTSRSAPPPPPSMPSAAEATPTQESDDEGEHPEDDVVEKSPLSATPASRSGIPPPVPIRIPESPKLAGTENTSSPTSDKRVSRPPPAIPMSPTTAAPQSRAPPPPPPGPPSRRSTSDSRGFGMAPAPATEASDEEEVTEYDGDYDTDIASGVKHKDALKSHNRDSSLDDGMLTDDALKGPKSPLARAAPPLPPVAAPRDLPPPPPPQSAPKTRRSVDAPRAAPPPIPPPKPADEEDYDPFRYSAPQQNAHAQSSRTPYATMLQSPKEELEEDDMYSAAPQQTFIPPPPADRSAPPPPLPEKAEYTPPPTGFAPAPPTGSPRSSIDIKRSGTISRRSVDHSRGSGEQGYIAHDIELRGSSMWWTQENTAPPSIQGRPDVLYEMETSSSTKRGGKTTISKDVYVLYMDYSQTTINAVFDASEPSHVTIEQRHERPPPAPRRDQLENASGQYGAQIARSAGSLLGTTVGDGSARALVVELLKPHSTALLPIGTRAYGALVYANLGNASTQQFDEIRPGDIVTFRNAKFAGHKGGLHSKYSLEAGKPEHVAVVLDWDGTKKKIRAWEQGRDLEKGKRAKVREESFKVGDLKSGEVMVWRVMPRTWVGWDTGKS